MRPVALSKADEIGWHGIEQTKTHLFISILYMKPGALCKGGYSFAHTGFAQVPLPYSTHSPEVPSCRRLRRKAPVAVIRTRRQWRNINHPATIHFIHDFVFEMRHNYSSSC